MELHYTKSGSGTITLVFLHYFGGAASTWDQVISLLQNEFRCIAVDLSGFGKSPSQNSMISIADSANAVVDLLTNLRLQNYILIGHSMGGKIALAVAATQPKGLVSLTLLAPSPPTPEPMTDKERTEMNEAFGNKDAVEKMINNVINKPLPKTIFDKEVNNNLEVSAVGWHSWPQLGSKEIIASNMEAIHVPIAIIYGGKDKKFTRHFLQKEFSKYFATFNLTEVKNSGHLLPAEAPEDVATEIRKMV